MPMFINTIYITYLIVSFKNNLYLPKKIVVLVGN